jgi:hypothetical protein
MHMQGVCVKCNNVQFYLPYCSRTCLLCRCLCGAAGAGEMSMGDVSQVYNEVVRELSLNLPLHDAAAQHAAEPGSANAPSGGPDGQLQLQGIQAAFDRWGNGGIGDMHDRWVRGA